MVFIKMEKLSEQVPINIGMGRLTDLERKPHRGDILVEPDLLERTIKLHRSAILEKYYANE